MNITIKSILTLATISLAAGCATGPSRPLPPPPPPGSTVYIYSPYPYEYYAPYSPWYSPYYYGPSIGLGFRFGRR